MSGKTIVVVMASALLAACATPSVKYQLYESGADHHIRSADEVQASDDTFVLSKTLLTVTVDEEAGTTIKAEPADWRDVVYGIKPVSSWWGVTTEIGITKFDDSDRPKAVSSAVDDKRAEFVTAVGKVLVAGIGTVKALGTPAREYHVDTLALLQKQHVGTGPTPADLDIDTPSGASLWVGAVPPDAMRREDLDLSRSAHAFFFSACREARLKYRGREYPFRLADPRYIELIAFPTKGRLTAQASCGMTVTSEQAQTESTLDVVKAGFDAIKDVADSLKKKSD